MLQRTFLALLLLLPACGKVGDPLPPFIRIPKPVNDLAAVQRGYDLILTWTNPRQYIDDSIATDLSRVRISDNGAPVEDVAVDSMPGQPQSFSISARTLIGSPQMFSIQVETQAGKVSAVSNVALITPVEVPGRVTELRYIVDENRITLEWSPPLENPELSDEYVIARQDDEPPVRVTVTRFADDAYETGKTYTYSVTAIRRIGALEIPGIGGSPVTVIAIDTTPPHVPSGLEIIPSDQGAFLTWTANPEADLAGYRVFRSDRANAGFMPLTADLRKTNEIFDPGYQAGLYYAVSAVDESGNESVMSSPYRAP